LKKRTTSQTEIDSAARNELLRLLSEGMPRAAAAQQAGVAQEVSRWAAIINPEIEEAMQKAEAEADGKVAQALFEAATSGNVQAAKLYLEARRTRRWRR
jgi:hypothetical protein